MPSRFHNFYFILSDIKYEKIDTEVFRKFNKLWFDFDLLTNALCLTD